MIGRPREYETRGEWEYSGRSSSNAYGVIKASTYDSREAPGNFRRLPQHCPDGDLIAPLNMRLQLQASMYRRKLETKYFPALCVLVDTIRSTSRNKISQTSSGPSSTTTQLIGNNSVLNRDLIFLCLSIDYQQYVVLRLRREIAHWYLLPRSFTPERSRDVSI